MTNSPPQVSNEERFASIILWDTGSQENQRKKALPRHSELWEMGSVGLGSILHQQRMDILIPSTVTITL